MKVLPALLYRSVFVLLALSLSACAPHSKLVSLQQHESQVSDDGSDASADEDASTLAEPEQTALEELAALERPGAWEHGASKQQHR